MDTVPVGVLRQTSNETIKTATTSAKMIQALPPRIVSADHATRATWRTLLVIRN